MRASAINATNETPRPEAASASIATAVGGIETLGVHHRFMEGFALGFGFDGPIAALLANGSPPSSSGRRRSSMPVADFWGERDEKDNARIAVLRHPSQRIASARSRPREIITVIQALIILSVSAHHAIEVDADRLFKLMFDLLRN